MVISYFVLTGKYFLKKWAEYIVAFLSSYKFKYNTQVVQYLSLEYKKWNYRGEGNEYLALSLPETKQILRIKKYPYSKGYFKSFMGWLCKHNKSLWKLETEAKFLEKLNLEYYKVMVFLIGKCYVQPAEEVFLIQNEIINIKNTIELLRPENRKKKHIGYVCGSILPDYAYLPSQWSCDEFRNPVYAIEIKPKQGWIPKSERVYPLCTFCLNQFIKYENREIATFSNYCPMDLFSGTNGRIKSAMKHLLETPQNNLKIFRNGYMVYGENMEKDVQNNILHEWLSVSENDTCDNIVDEFCDLTKNALLANLFTNNLNVCEKFEHHLENVQNGFHVTNSQRKCDFKRERLPKGCVLNRILRLQQLDELGCENLLALLEHSKACNESEKYEHVKSVITRLQHRITSDCPHCFFEYEQCCMNKLDTELKNEQIQNMLQRYLMSAVAKDCSLMLTFQKIDNAEKHKIPESNILVTKSGVRFAFNVAVFDLYPKNVSSIHKHVKKRHHFQKIFNELYMDFN